MDVVKMKEVMWICQISLLSLTFIVLIAFLRSVNVVNCVGS